MSVNGPIGPQLIHLSDSISNSAADLLSSRYNIHLSLHSTLLLKLSYDLTLQDELTSFNNLNSLLNPATRSSSTSQQQQLLPATPISELTITGMDHEMIWDQLEMRNSTIANLLDEMLGGPTGEEEDSVDFQEDEDDQEAAEDSDETGETSSDAEPELYHTPLKDTSTIPLLPAKRRRISPSSSTTEQEDSSSLSLSNFDDLQPSTSSSASTTSKSKKRSEVDDDFFNLEDFHTQVERGEIEMDKLMRGELSDDEDDGLDLFKAVDEGEDLSESDDEMDHDLDEDEEDEEEDLDANGSFCLSLYILLLKLTPNPNNQESCLTTFLPHLPLPNPNPVTHQKQKEKEKRKRKRKQSHLHRLHHKLKNVKLKLDSQIKLKLKRLLLERIKGNLTMMRREILMRTKMMTMMKVR